MILGDMGADVIKIERPGSGDETRHWGPPFASDGESAYYLSVNRNKLSAALDLDDAEDRTVFLGLAGEADVVLENFLPGTLERRGIDVAQVLRENRRLVWCTISGYGPGSDRPGYDFAVQAECGWMSVTGVGDGEPMKVGVALADVVAGKDAAIAILGALHARNQRSEGMPAEERLLHVSLLRSATAALVNVAQNTLVSGEDARRWGNGHPNLVPYQLFHAADRPLVIAVGNDAQWKRACRALSLDALAEDPGLATNAGRLARRDEVVEAFEHRVSERTAVQWLGILGAAGVPCGLVKSVREALQDSGASAVTGVPPAVPGVLRFLPPRLDQHGEAIRRLGWSAFHT
jgi:crotonobetainyl-CoA:carnitine CoA-transferase CaiB-like acyl-CoA transferase